MTDFFVMLGSFYQRIFDKLTLYSFEVNGISVSLPAIWFAILVVGLVITIFWRGAKT